MVALEWPFFSPPSGLGIDDMFAFSKLYGDICKWHEIPAYARWIK